MRFDVRDMGMTYWLEKAEAEMREMGRRCGVHTGRASRPIIPAWTVGRCGRHEGERRGEGDVA